MSVTLGKVTDMRGYSNMAVTVLPFIPSSEIHPYSVPESRNTRLYRNDPICQWHPSRGDAQGIVTRWQEHNQCWDVYYAEN